MTHCLRVNAPLVKLLRTSRLTGLLPFTSNMRRLESMSLLTKLAVCLRKSSALFTYDLAPVQTAHFAQKRGSNLLLFETRKRETKLNLF